MYSQAIELVKSILDEDLQIHTKIHGQTTKPDLYKKNIYPIAHLNPQGFDYSNIGYVSNRFELAVLDQRLITTDTVEDKFYGNDNESDNLDLTQNILVTFIGKLRQRQLSDGMQVANISTGEPFIYKDHNILDGWVVTFDILVPVTDISFC